MQFSILLTMKFSAISCERSGTAVFRFPVWAPNACVFACSPAVTARSSLQDT